MPIDQKRGTALLIGAAVGIAAFSSNVSADESRALPWIKMAQAQQQEGEQEERRRRRRDNDEGGQQGSGDGAENQQEEGRGRRRGDGGDEGQRRSRQEQRQERRDDQAEGQRSQREERRERTEQQQEQGQERRENLRERIQERVEERRREQRDEAQERQERRQEQRREERRDDARERQERRQERREDARDNQRQQELRREVEERRRERAERRRDNSEQVRERRQEREEFSRRRLKDVTRERREIRQGGRIILEEPGGRRIVRENGRAIIRHDELDRFRGAGRDFREERTRRGHNRRIVTRPNGVQIITVVDENGRVLRRVKRLPNGRRVVLFNNERREGRRRGRDRDGGFSFFIDLSPPRINIPRDDYYLYADRASEEDIYEALSAPPVEDLEDSYTLDEVLYNRSVRSRMRTVNLNTINFEFGSWEIGEGQIERLANMADAILSIVEKNPNEVILIAGHTDAVGSDEDNLSLSDRRAETVARVLTDEFGVAPENLVTQGYGEEDLLVNTQSAEVQNRRVEFQRVTPLLAQDESADE